MSKNTISNTEKYKNPNETEKEWRLKSQFIEKFKHQFDEDRLVCLAQCYVNIETMGCRYPIALMNQIRELTADFKDNQSNQSILTTNNKVNNSESNNQTQKQTYKKQQSLNEQSKSNEAKQQNQYKQQKQSQPQQQQQLKQITILTRNPKIDSVKKPLNPQFQTINQLNNQQTKFISASPPKTYNFNSNSNKSSPKFTTPKTGLPNKPITKITSSSTLACPSSTTEQSPAPSLVPIPFGLATPESFTSSCVNKLDFNNEPSTSSLTNTELTFNQTNKSNPLAILLNATSSTTDTNDSQFQKLSKLTKLRNTLKSDIKILNYINNKPNLELTKQIIEYFKQTCAKCLIKLDYVQYVTQDNRNYTGEIYLENYRLIKVQDIRAKRCNLYAHKKALFLLQGPNELAVRVAPLLKRDSSLKLRSSNEIDFEYELYLVDSDNSISSTNNLKFDDDDFDDLNEIDDDIDCEEDNNTNEDSNPMNNNMNHIFHLNTMLKSLVLPNVKADNNNNTNKDNDDDDDDENDTSLSKRERIKEILPNFCIFLTGTSDAMNIPNERNAISILNNSCIKSNYNLEFELKLKGQQLAIKMSTNDSEDEYELINDSTGKKKYKCKCIINGLKISSANAKSKIECKRAAALKSLNYLMKIFKTLKDTSYINEMQNIEYQQEQCMSLPAMHISSSTSSNPSQQRYFKISKEDLFKGLVPPTLFESLSLSVPSHATNLGKKLLLKMGWKGKGLGRYEQGRVEPLELEENRLRLGLGMSLYANDFEYGEELKELDKNSFTTTTTNDNDNNNNNNNKKNNNNINNMKKKKDLIYNIVDLLRNYISSPTQNDLIFDKALNKEDRKLIHREANRLGLKTKSVGDDQNRFLIVRKKYTNDELIEAALNNGGSVGSYILVNNNNIIK